MSSNHNDKNQTIHLGNYEEFFILYMDNELTDDQMKMVDTFLAAHPDLQSEFDLLLSTRLPMEEFSFDKESLMADRMKLDAVEEELLLYIDNELPADRKTGIEKEIASDKNISLQHQLLLKTKLDASEKIVFPNKEELYHRKDRVVYFRPWMRIAAAAVIIAALGIVYFTNSSSTIQDSTSGTVANTKPVTTNEGTQKDSTIPYEETTSNEIAEAPQQTANEDVKNAVRPDRKSTRDIQPVMHQQIAVHQDPLPNDIISPDPTGLLRRPSRAIDNNVVANNSNIETVNKLAVTSSLPERNTIMNAAPKDVAGNEKKGSVKGFLRKATRLIEKRTGIDPLNEDGELLIGIVAVKLK